MNERERIKEELEELHTLRNILTDRIARLQNRLIAPAYKADNGGHSVVNSQDLVPYIQAWIDNHKPLYKLASLCHVSEQTLRAVLTGERATIKESTADKILTALELPHVFNEIVPEPPEDYHYQED